MARVPATAGLFFGMSDVFSSLEKLKKEPVPGFPIILSPPPGELYHMSIMQKKPVFEVDLSVRNCCGQKD